jgi:hypothetical protein
LGFGLSRFRDAGFRCLFTSGLFLKTGCGATEASGAIRGSPTSAGIGGGSGAASNPGAAFKANKLPATATVSKQA